MNAGMSPGRGQPAELLITESSVDTLIPKQIQQFFIVISRMLVKLVAIVIYAPLALIAGVGVTWLGISWADLYLKAQLPIKREMSNAKAPVLGQYVVQFAWSY
jgi:hypothetical protein